jgi:hypothetical protein
VFWTLYFLVKSGGYSYDESNWKLRISLGDAVESIEEFYKVNPEALVTMTWEQDWRGGGAPVRDIGKMIGYKYTETTWQHSN